MRALLAEELPLELRSRVIEWKLKYGPIFLIQIGDSPFVIRSLTKGEFKACQEVIQSLTEEDIEDSIVGMCLLWPMIDVSLLAAGVVPKLSQTIIDFSGFSDSKVLKTLVQNERNINGTVDFQFDAILGAAFKLKANEVDNLNAYQLSKLVTRAETILQTEFNILTEEDIEKINKQQEKQESKRERFRQKLDKRADQKGAVHKRHRTDPDKYIAPGGSPEQIQAIKDEEANRIRTQAWLEKRGIKKKIYSKDVQKLIDRGITEAATIDNETVVALKFLKEKQKSGDPLKSDIDLSQLVIDGRS